MSDFIPSSEFDEARRERIADLERVYAEAQRMCVHWKGQRDVLRIACGYAAQRMHDEVQPEDGSLLANILADLDDAMRETRDFGDRDYDHTKHADEVIARRPQGPGR